jgi:DnaJ domain
LAAERTESKVLIKINDQNSQIFCIHSVSIVAMNFENAIAMFILVLYSFDNAQAVDSSDEYIQFVEEILSEDESYYNDYVYVNESDEQIRRDKKEFEKETVRSKNFITENERIQALREESFARELAQVKKEDRATAKKLLQQKNRDAQTADRIFRSFQSNDYYSVLGIRNFAFSNLRIPNRTMTIIPKYFVVHIPGFDLFNISEKQIKRAYREMAKLVHPDKSKDPRAVKVFLMVENAAAVLLNDVTRSEYDMMILKERRERQTRMLHQIRQGIEKSFMMTNTVLHSARKLLGPFSIPVVVLVALVA